MIAGKLVFTKCIARQGVSHKARRVGRVWRLRVDVADSGAYVRYTTAAAAN